MLFFLLIKESMNMLLYYAILRKTRIRCQKIEHALHISINFRNFEFWISVLIPIFNLFSSLVFLGLVFYQHKNLHLEKHGYYNVVKRGREKNERDYELWKEGKWLPTPR